ncbi:bromodomain-containing 8-like isoform X2 [Labeo rohita]|uniref:Bromodomain-containing protein 8 n=1 Tax=Labeo rohita TaxID=84645 RepID=A0A498NEZ3_LABRO|nr:bromodomain-containing 8-like isoform X2 [Labeo rohita]
MSTGVGKHKMLSLGPTEPWSIREKLCLASSVMRSGDQNWRKRGEKGEVVETIEDVIVRRLTAERIEELKRLIKDTQEKYRKLKKEVDLIQAGHMDPKLEELWADIELKRKQEEEEAEQKKRATEAAYQVRQAAKNTPKRVPSVTVRSPPGASSPSMDVSQPDTLQQMTDESCASPMAQGLTVLMPVPEVTGPGPKESGLGPLVDDSPQKKHLAPKATPPPSPLLSELLKKGSLIAASSRLVVEGDVATGLSNGSHGVELHTAATALPANQDITADAPTLSRLLESSTPAQQPVSADPPKPPTVVPPAPDHLSVPKTGAAAVAEGSGAEAVMAGSSTPAEVEGKEAEVVEEDTVVSVSYMGHELDLETVGDIIAIIEEKVDDPVEALDAAAVEAALSLCEDPAVGGHPLTSPWESQTFKAAEPEPIIQQSPAPVVTQSCPDPAGVQGEEMEVLVEEATEAEVADEVTGDTVVPAAPDTEQSQDSEVKTEGEREGEAEGGMEETQQENRTPSPAVKCEGEDWVQPETVTPCLDSEDSSASAKDTKVYYNLSFAFNNSLCLCLSSMCSEDQEALQAQKIWKKAIMLVWRAAANHRYASVFLQPVSDDIAPGYHSIVHRPMDLSAIKKNIESGQIRTTAEFQRDIMLMFQNAVMYNSSDHDVYHMALEMQRDVLEQIQQFLATQLIMQTSESGISTKSLRGREANRKQDPNEKDSLSMASPAFLLSLFDGGTRGRRSAIEADMKMKK